MAGEHGRFIWYELICPDPAAAQKFYGQVVGWDAIDAGGPEMHYWMFRAGGTPVAGLMDVAHIPEEARHEGAPPSWIGYVYVDDVDACTATAQANGGTVYMPPAEIPEVGRFAIIGDPSGAAIGLFKVSSLEQFQLPQQTQPGHIGWNELHGGDPAPTLDFYAKLFGWQKQEAMDMGEMGVYQMFGFGETMLGGMMKKTPQEPMAHWSYYFNVGNIDDAVGRVKAAGGQLFMDPVEVPGGGWVTQGMDPQGAAFALFGSR